MNPLQSLNLPVSAQGEWAAKRFYGDSILATAYLPLAYALLGMVKNRMALGGITYGHQILHLPNGGTIRVLRNGAYNILEIDVTQVYPSPSSSLGGKHGFIFYPKTKTAPLGIYPPGTQAVFYPLPVSEPPWLPFSTLSYQYVEDGNTFNLTATAPTGAQAGNQFFFAEDGAVYSWWHSPCGDGPLTRFAHKGITYAPYLSGTSLRYYTAASQTASLGAIIYKGGAPWFLVPVGTGEVIAGFWTGAIEIEKDVLVQRYVVALYSMRCQVIIKAFNNPQLLSSGMTTMDVVPTESLPLVWGGSNINTSPNSVSWPIKISSTGDKAALILINDSDPVQYDKDRANQMVVAELSITHKKDSFSYRKAGDIIYPMGTRKETSRIIYRYNWETPKSANGGGFHRFGACTGSQYAQYADEYEFVGASDQYPVALSYTSSDELHVAFLALAKGKYFSGAEAASAISMDVTTDIYTERSSPRGVHVEQVYTASGEGFARNLYSHHQQRANSNFSVVDSHAKVLVPTIKTGYGEKNEISGTHTWDVHYLSDTMSTPWRTISNATYVKNMKGSQISSGVAGTGYVRFINLREDVVLYYVMDSASGGYAEETRDDYRRDDANSTWPGTGHREIEHHIDNVGTNGSTQKIGVSLVLSVGGKQYQYADGAEANNETSKEYHDHYLEVDDKIMLNTRTGTFNSPYPNIMTPGIYRTCNIYEIAAPNIAGVSNDTSATVTESVVSASEMVMLFYPAVPIEFSYAGDYRTSKPPVWAYSFKLLWKTSFNDPAKGLILLELKDTKTDSTFGPLNKHIPVLDKDGKTTEETVTDPTLTVYPIGLF